MSDSSTYDPQTLSRHFLIAQELMKQGQKPATVWSQGLANLANSAMGGYENYLGDKEVRDQNAINNAAMEKIAASLPGGGGASAPLPVGPVADAGPDTATAPATPSVPMPVPTPTPPIQTARPEVMPSPTVWGDKEAEAAGLYEPRKMAAALNAPVKPIAPASPAGPAIVPPAAPEDAIPPTAAPAQGALPTAPIGGGPTPQQKEAITLGLKASPGSPARAIAQALMTKFITPETPVNVGGKLVLPSTGKVVYDGGDTTPKFGVIGEDAMGRKQYGFANPDNKTVTPVNPPAGANPVPDNLAELHGPEYMAAIKQQDPKLANQVQAIIEGRAPYPTGMLLKTPYGQMLAQHVTQADPSFESGNATSRVKARNEFTSGGVGSPAGQITAGNTALQHAGEMSDALERMKKDRTGVTAYVGDKGLPFVSYWANEANNKSIQGTPAGAALNDFMTAKNHFSEEVTKFYAGSAGSEAERTRALANLDAAKSLPELRSAIKTEVNLMQGKVNALQDRWSTAMGPLVPKFPLIQPKSQEAIDRVIKRHEASQEASPAVSGPDPAAIAEAKRRGLIP